MFADIEPPRYLVTEDARVRLPPLDMSVIPHCSGFREPDVVDQRDVKPDIIQGPSESLNSSPDRDLSEFLPRQAVDRSMVVSDDDKISPPPSQGKGKGKGKNRVKTSEQLSGKTKFAGKTTFAGAHTRLRAKQEKEAKEKAKSGMEKLLSTGRKLSESEPVDQGEPSQPLVGDFSSHDLIRNSIAYPPVFDEPNPQAPISDEITVVSLDNGVPRTQTGNVNNRWSFSLNPLSYFQQPTPPNNDNNPKEGNQRGSLGTGPVTPPQMTSTPTD